MTKYNELAKALRNYAKDQTDESLTRYCNDIADGLEDEEYVKSLDNTNIGVALDSLQEASAQYNGNINSEMSNPHYREPLFIFYSGFMAYRIDKKRNVSIFSQKIREFEQKLEDSEERIDNIKKVSDTLSGAEALNAYAEKFLEQSQKHKENAKRWLMWLIRSIIILMIIIAALLHFQIAEFPLVQDWLSNDIKSTGTLNVIILTVKASVIMAYVQIPLFLRKNYFAEKHLEQSALHRSNVLNSLYAVYNTINDQEERNKIITVGSTVAFSEPESGFITRKEGAGSDGGIDAILRIIGK